MKTNVLFYDSLFSIGNLLYQIVRFGMKSDIKYYENRYFFGFCSSLGWQLYMEHYEREFPSLFLSRSHIGGTHTAKEEDQEAEEMDEGHVTAPGGVAIPLHPPSLVHWLRQKLMGKQVRERERERKSKNHAPIIFHHLNSLYLSLCCQLFARELLLY
jgi:hypothetical protein